MRFQVLGQSGWTDPNRWVEEKGGEEVLSRDTEHRRKTMACDT